MTTVCWRPWIHKCLKLGSRVEIFWNRIFLSSCVNWQAECLLTMLMLMLTQVNAFHSGHYQTPVKHSTVHQKQSIWRQSLEANLSVCSIILEVNLWLNFFHYWLLRASQQQEVNNFGCSDKLIRHYKLASCKRGHILKTQGKDLFVFSRAAPV